MSGRLVAALVWGVSWGLALAAVLLSQLFRLGSEPLPGVFLSAAPMTIRSSFALIGITVALLYGPVSALLLARRAHPVGVILAVHAIGSGLAAFGVQWGLLGERYPGLPLWGMLAFAAGWGYVPGTLLTAVLPILVTRSRIGRAQRGLVWVGALVAGLTTAVCLIQQSVPAPRNPFAVPVPAVQAVLPAAYLLLTVLAVGLSVITCAVLVGRWRTSRGRSRTGTAWLTIGHLFLTLSYAMLVLPESVPVPGWLPVAGLIAPVVGQVLYPAAILVVVLGQRLWGVELVVSRAVLWALLTIGGVGAYLVAVLLASWMLPGAEQLWIAIPLIVALAVSPLRAWLQHRIDVLIYGEGADPASALMRLGDRIGELEPGVEGMQQLCAALRQTLRLGVVEVRSERSPLRARAGAPARAGAEVSLPLRSGSERVGALLVRAPEGQRLDARTLAVLGDVSGLVAAALCLIEANVTLDAVRGDLVAHRALERRSIQRQLHDGLGPALAGLGFGLAAVENLAETRPERAEELLAGLEEDLASRVRTVRTLANDVSASPLDGTTLADALGALSRRFSSDELTVTARIERMPLPRAVEEAVYFLAAEALTNVARHARASAASVTVRADGEQVLVRIEDDGVGIPADHEPGIGLVSIRHRAESLSGCCVITGSAAGTTVEATIPIPAGQSPADPGVRPADAQDEDFRPFPSGTAAGQSRG